MALQGTLRHPNRLITTHNDKGEAILDTSIEPAAPFYSIGGGPVGFAQCYVTDDFPVKVQDGADLAVYQKFLKEPPGLTVRGGTVLRFVDMPPAHVSPMHVTTSLDYGVVIEGSVELILDSGETRPMHRGDVCVQRATMHAWRNMSDTEWARMLYVLQPIEPTTVAGKEVKENLGDMEGVKASS